MHTTTVRTSRTNVKPPNDDGDDRDDQDPKRRNIGKNTGQGSGKGKPPRKFPNKQTKGPPRKKTIPPVKRPVPLPHTTVVGGTYKLGGTGENKGTYDAAKAREKVNIARRREQEEKMIMEEFLHYQQEEKRLAEIRRNIEIREKQNKLKEEQRRQKLREEWNGSSNRRSIPNSSRPKHSERYDVEDEEMQQAIALSLQATKNMEIDEKSGKSEEGFISNAVEMDYEDEYLQKLREEELQLQLQIEKQFELERKRKEMMRKPIDPKVEEDRILREQQEYEYFAALEADKQKEREEREKVEREQKEEQMKIKAENDIKELRLSKKMSLAKEPEQNEPDATTLMFRMPNGDKISRRFLLSDKLEVLMNFVESLGVDFPLQNNYEVRADFPKRIYPKNSEKLQLSLKEVGIAPKEVLTIVEL